MSLEKAKMPSLRDKIRALGEKKVEPEPVEEKVEDVTSKTKKGRRLNK